MDLIRGGIGLLSRLSSIGLSEHAAREALSFMGSELALLRGVGDEVDRLRRHTDRIRSLLSDAEDRRYIDDAFVKQWLSGLRALLFDADDPLDLHNTLFLRPDPNPNRKRKRSWLALDRPLCRHRIGAQIAEIHKRLAEIAEGRKNFRLRPGYGRWRAPVGERRHRYQFPSSSSCERANDQRRWQASREGSDCPGADLRLEDGCPRSPHLRRRGDREDDARTIGV
uniref:Disease resistance N-terminal domain-containing protein n=1 Tax=Ananas comosus var. bracteatus TaxID=296719 RepID=A0A6V7PDP9_ANACO|nr:unnamed protein product [Ananas comosus var. bracteatus]